MFLDWFTLKEAFFLQLYQDTIKRWLRSPSLVINSVVDMGRPASITCSSTANPLKIVGIPCSLFSFAINSSISSYYY